MKQQTTKPVTRPEIRELSDAELEQVSGGTIVLEEVKNQNKNGRSTLDQPATMVRAGKKILNSL